VLRCTCTAAVLWIYNTRHPDEPAAGAELDAAATAPEVHPSPSPPVSPAAARFKEVTALFQNTPSVRSIRSGAIKPRTRQPWASSHCRCPPLQRVLHGVGGVSHRSCSNVVQPGHGEVVSVRGTSEARPGSALCNNCIRWLSQCQPASLPPRVATADASTGGSPSRRLRCHQRWNASGHSDVRAAGTKGLVLVMATAPSPRCVLIAFGSIWIQ
jgi:hypothetical protein